MAMLGDETEFGKRLENVAREERLGIERHLV